MFRRILVPLDGSPRSECALPFAISIAAASGGTVFATLVHEPEAYSQFAEAHVEDFDDEGKRQEAAYLNTIAARFPGPLVTLHLEGIVEETLVEEVRRREIDLVVMNANGWGYSARAVLGSVSDYLLRNLTLPLLLMHLQPPARRSEDIRFHRILLPLDGSELAASIRSPALELGRVWGARFHLVRVVSPLVTLQSWMGAQLSAAEQAAYDAAKGNAKHYLDSVSALMANQNVQCTTRVAIDSKVAVAILHEAAAADCDAIALSTSGRGGLSRLLVGSVADKVVRGSDVPVLVYRPGEH